MSLKDGTFCKFCAPHSTHDSASLAPGADFYYAPLFRLSHQLLPHKYCADQAGELLNNRARHARLCHTDVAQRIAACRETEQETHTKSSRPTGHFWQLQPSQGVDALPQKQTQYGH